MISDRKLSANRKNAARSSGPRTKAGTDRSRCNAVRHGLTSRTLVVEGEDAEAFQLLADEHMAVFRPRDAVEREFAQTFSIAAWQRMRCASAETAMANQHIREAQAEADLAKQQEVLELGERLFFDRDGLWERHPDPSTHVIPKSGRGNPHFPDPDSPARLVNRLEASLEGCRWLLDRWNELRVRNQPGNSWQGFDKLKAIKLLGKDPVAVADDISGDIAVIFLATHVICPTSKSAFAELRCEVEREWFCALLKRLEGRHVERLKPENEAEARQLLNNLIDRAAARLEMLAAGHKARALADAAERTSRLAFDPRPAADKVRRYKLASVREMSRACRDLLMLRKSGMLDAPDQPGEPPCSERCAGEAVDANTNLETDLPPDESSCPGDHAASFTGDGAGSTGPPAGRSAEQWNSQSIELTSTSLFITSAHITPSDASPTVSEEPPALTGNGGVERHAAPAEPVYPIATQEPETTIEVSTSAVHDEPAPCGTDWQTVPPSDTLHEEHDAECQAANVETDAPRDESGSAEDAQPTEPTFDHPPSAVDSSGALFNAFLLLVCFWYFAASGNWAALSASQFGLSPENLAASPSSRSVACTLRVPSAQTTYLRPDSQRRPGRTIPGRSIECRAIKRRDGTRSVPATFELAESTCPAGPIHRIMNSARSARNEPTVIRSDSAGSSGQVESALSRIVALRSAKADTWRSFADFGLRRAQSSRELSRAERKATLGVSLCGLSGSPSSVYDQFRMAFNLVPRVRAGQEGEGLRMSGPGLAETLGRFDPTSPRYATEVVEKVLSAAKGARASDVHFQPRGDGLELRWRIDGVLHDLALLPVKGAPNIVARLKVLADLLTYRTDIPQEGRIRGAPGDLEMRLSTFPTLFGEKAVVRMFAEPGKFLRLDDLGLPRDVRDQLALALEETSGAIVLSGPAGAGKTTTIYACLRELAARARGERSLVSMEDPIEAIVEGVAQSQVNTAAGLTLESGLKSLLRQDPEVIAIGEIRDKTTAEIALEAALTGHLILTTLHAGSACEVIGRLLDMGIEPYVVRSGLRAVVAQRLVRRLCACASPARRAEDFLGLPVRSARLPGGCESCRGTGYVGRTVLAEMLLPEEDELAHAVLARSDVRQLERTAMAAGMIDRWERACAAVEAGLTSPAEIRRVLGIARSPERRAASADAESARQA